MALKSTSLLIQMAPLSPTFKGGPQDLATEMIRRMKILSPSGTNFIFIGDTAPTSNVGPWLKDGTKWWVWSEATKTYVPLDVSDSVTKSYWLGNSLPAGTNPPLWLKTTQDATEANPTAFGEIIGWTFWDGTHWTGLGTIILAGPTASRPSSPDNLQMFYDTDISTLIWFERNLWRTVTGVPGDIKFVSQPVLSLALVQNPGWDYLGRTTVNARGRALIGATQDPGTSPASNFPPQVTVPSQSAGATGGDTVGLTPNPGGSTTLTPVIAYWVLVKL